MFNPWTFLDHLHDAWAQVVGQAHPCPDGIETAWIRRVIPDEHDSNRLPVEQNAKILPFHRPAQAEAQPDSHDLEQKPPE